MQSKRGNCESERDYAPLPCPDKMLAVVTAMNYQCLVKPAIRTSDMTASSPANQHVNVGPADSFHVGRVRIVMAGPREIGVVRRADGQVDAVRNWCPHKGAPICKGPLTGTMLPGEPGTLTWGRDGEILRCPWHGFEFEIATGARPYSDSRMHLRVYPARIEDGEIWVVISPRRA